MQNIRVTLSSFFEYRSTLFSDQLETANALKLELSKIDTDSDWSLFKASHNGRFVEPGDPEFTLKNLSYDGHDDPSVRSVKEGPLFRKEGVIVRGYKPVYGVLTASGYLHLTPPLSGEYPDNPELSLDLTECQLQPLMMNEKEPEEISFLTQGGIFGGEKKHKIKGKGMADSAEWWGALNEQIRKQGKRQPRTLDTEPAISVSNSKIVTSPTETNTASQNPSKPNLPSRNQSDLMGFETPPPAPSEHESELHYNQTSPTAHSTDPTYHDPPPANASVINSAEPSNQFADLALADQMELALKMKTSSNTAPQSSGNPWDSFQADTPDW